MSTPAEPTTSPSHVGHGAESAFRPGDVIAGSFPADARGFVISFEGTVVAVDDVGARPTGLVIFRATSKHCAHPGHPERGRSLPAGEMHAIEPNWARNITRPSVPVRMNPAIGFENGPAGTVNVPNEVVDFLHGMGPLDGVHFGERHPTERGEFWRRKHLPTSAPAPGNEARPARKGPR
jgi:hypothetical protein